MTTFLQDLRSVREGKNWCLFLDRDGTLNKRIPGGYVTGPEELELLDGVAESVAKLRYWAPQIVVLTNQQGIGKGIMEIAQVDEVHTRLEELLAEGGGFLDSIIHCPHLTSEGCFCRKPEPGMALAWLAKNSHIDPSLSIMVGDSSSDVDMAERLTAEVGGCQGILVGQPVTELDPHRFDSLPDFVAQLGFS